MLEMLSLVNSYNKNTFKIFCVQAQGLAFGCPKYYKRKERKKMSLSLADRTRWGSDLCALWVRENIFYCFPFKSQILIRNPALREFLREDEVPSTFVTCVE